jgi:hypothetical protein
MAPGIIRAMNADGSGCGKISRKKSPENFITTAPVASWFETREDALLTMRV